jgi:hypothetical protein
VLSIAQYERTYELWAKVLKEYQDNIKTSGDTRVYLMKNLSTVDAEDLLRHAVDCIAAMTGDTVLRERMKSRLPRVCQEPYPYREPNPNTYIKAIDCGSQMLECPECKCRIIYNAFTYAVGNRGFSFCPYCGKDRRKQHGTD